MWWVVTAYATGIELGVQARVVDAECGVAQSATTSLHVTFEDVNMACAPPSPGRQNCSESRRAVPAGVAAVHLTGCALAEPGHFAPTSRTCDGLPVWEWTGTLREGRHTVVHGGNAGRFESTSGVGPGCPEDGVRTALPEVGRQVLPVVPTFVDFDKGDFALEDGDPTRVSWTSERMRQWTLQVPTVLVSEPLAREQAVLALGGEPSVVSVEWGAAGVRYNERFRVAGQVACIDHLDQTFRMVLTGSGVVLTGAASLVGEVLPGDCGR